MTDDRLERLRSFAEREPDDDVAQYGYGRACLEAGRIGDAVRALSRVLEISPEYSAAYRDLGRALLESRDEAGAIDVLGRGIEVARRRGDLQTVREMEVFVRRAKRRLEKRS